MKKNAKKKPMVNAIVKINGKLDEKVLPASVKQGQAVTVTEPATDDKGAPIMKGDKPLFEKVQVRVISIVGPV